MRTLRITLWASLAGWIAGFLAGNVGGVILVATLYGLREVWTAVTVTNWLASELWWGVAVASGMLPGCALVVAPLVFWQLGRSLRWHPLLALGVGGAGGVVALFLWLGVLALFGQPVNWSHRDDRAATTMLVGVGFVIGAVTGGVAAWLARSYRPIDAPVAAAGATPTPPSYDY